MSVVKPTRRQLLALGLGGLAAAGGLVVGVKLNRRRDWVMSRIPDREASFVPNAFVAVGTDDVVRFYLIKTEFGQGVMTALPMILADEMGADWERLEVVQDIARPEHQYLMLTAVSDSVRGSYLSLREAGAVARTLLVEAAARRWGVSTDACRVETGRVIGPSAEARFGELAEDAQRLPIPWLRMPALRPDAELSLIGTSPPRRDVPAKTTGAAEFAIDVRLDGMRYAVLARPRRLGARVVAHDASDARAMDGVEAVVPLGHAVAVVAGSTWAALQGAKAVKLTTEGGSDLSTDSVRERLRARLDAGVEAWRRGPPLGEVPPSLEAEFEFPLLAHATMEPMCCVARVGAEDAEIWAPTQAQLGLQHQAAGWLGLPPERIVVRTPLVGGAFGRRVEQDFTEAACRVAQAVGHPVKLLYPREDDLRHDFYRPPSLHRLTARLDGAGRPIAWRHLIASPSIIGREDPSFEGVDSTSVEGSSLPYAVEQAEVRWANVPLEVPVGFWRSVGHSYNAFAVEHFLDRIARSTGRDPVALRRALLAESPRHLGVLERAAEAAGWDAPAPEGRARGVAVHESFGSWVAQVAEVSVEEGAVRVHRVVAAADVGRVVHPDTVVAQIEGGIVFGLGAALYGRIDLDDGAVRQSNFHDYRILSYGETPEIEVHLLESAEPPGGVGEIAVPPIGPAVANALLALTGRPTSRLPLTAQPWS